MYESAYDIFTLGMRYFFAAIIVYILFRLVHQSVTEFNAMQRLKQHVRSISPGYLEALAPKDLKGEKYALKRENTVGRSKRCSICIAHESIAPLHMFIYQKKQGLFLSDYGRAGVYLNGERIRKREELLYTRDSIAIGDLTLVLHLEGEELEEEDA